jgi:hypothetical protein
MQPFDQFLSPKNKMSNFKDESERLLLMFMTMTENTWWKTTVGLFHSQKLAQEWSYKAKRLLNCPKVVEDQQASQFQVANESTRHLRSWHSRAKGTWQFGQGFSALIDCLPVRHQYCTSDGPANLRRNSICSQSSQDIETAESFTYVQGTRDYSKLEQRKNWMTVCSGDIFHKTFEIARKPWSARVNWARVFRKNLSTLKKPKTPFGLKAQNHVWE